MVEIMWWLMVLEWVAIVYVVFSLLLSVVLGNWLLLWSFCGWWRCWCFWWSFYVYITKQKLYKEG